MASAKKKRNSATKKVVIDPRVLKDINDLKSAMYQVANALRQFQLYAKGERPTEAGLNMLNDYLNAIDKTLTPGAIRGLMTP